MKRNDSATHHQHSGGDEDVLHRVDDAEDGDGERDEEHEVEGNEGGAEQEAFA